MHWVNSAFKHGISEARSRYVIEHAFGIFDVPASDDLSVDRFLYLGDDANGVALEVVVAEVQTDDGEWQTLVIHAMPMRAAYRALYEEALRARVEEAGPWQH